MNAVCPECDCPWDLDSSTMRGEIVTCPDCGVELEVIDINTKPVTVEIVKPTFEDIGE